MGKGEKSSDVWESGRKSKGGVGGIEIKRDGEDTKQGKAEEHNKRNNTS